MDTIAGWKRSVEEGANPRDIKVRLAQELVTRFHSRAAAERALEEFDSRFRHGGVPQDLPEQILEVPAEGMAIAQILKASGVCPSTSDAVRMVEQGGVKVNGDKVSDKGLRLAVGATYVIQVGKRKFAKVTLRPSR
jgi:tyrosyl-tRNA synthetase